MIRLSHILVSPSALSSDAVDITLYTGDITATVPGIHLAPGLISDIFNRPSAWLSLATPSHSVPGEAPQKPPLTGEVPCEAGRQG